MDKGKVNSDFLNRHLENLPRPEWNDASIASDPSFAESHPTERFPEMRVDELLPFLHERVAFTMPSELRHLDGVLEYLNERMLRLGLVTHDDSEVLIALDEAIVNAIKHGNKCDSRKAVHIVAEFNADGVRFTIADEGAGFELSSVPDPTQPCRLLEPTGRGLLLINHIMDEVCFNQRGNQLEMFKRAGAKRPLRSQSSDPLNLHAEATQD